MDGKLSAQSLAGALWDAKKAIVEAAGYRSAEEIRIHLQNIVDVYAGGKVYDRDSNIVDLSGQHVENATAQSKRHMAGELNSKTRVEHSKDFLNELQSIDFSQFLNQTAADVSKICGVQMIKPAAECTVSQLRDFVGAQGGKISGRKDELVKVA